MNIPWGNIKVLVTDFDGVHTDGFVYVDQDGKEMVKCSRKDGLGIEMLKKAGIDVAVISKEKNSVVSKRCEKLGIACYHGIDEKLKIFQKIMSDYGAEKEHVCYIGDDIIDISPMAAAGIGVAVADAHPLVRRAADFVTERKGGDHAVREVCDLIISSLE